MATTKNQGVQEGKALNTKLDKALDSNEETASPINKSNCKEKEKCKLCLKTFTKGIGIAIHMERSHNQCRRCTKNFINYKSLNLHRKSNLCEERKCMWCRKLCPTSQDTRNHEETCSYKNIKENNHY